MFKPWPNLCFAYCLLPTAYCLLPTAYCLLPTAYCLLPTSYFLLPTYYCVQVNRVDGRLGIGRDNDLCVTELVPGGPGFVAGVQVDDQLVEVKVVVK